MTIDGINQNSTPAEAVFAYDFPGRCDVPSTITEAKDCCRQPALAGVRAPVRPHLGTAGVAPTSLAA